MRYVVTGSARTTALAATVILWCATTVQAQLPTPNLTTVFPPGAKQGSTLSVTTGGGNLDDGAQLLFSHPGITAVVKKNAATEFNPTPDPTYNQFDVTVAADVPAGVYDARVVGQFGVSSPRAFVVGGLDEINDDGSNKTFATAKQIDVNTTVNGVADGSAVDFYKFTMKRGQRVLIDCAADRIDSRLNGTLTLFDAANKQLQRNRDSLGDDPILDFTAPADGDYVVGVNDFVYSGGGEYFYRLTIHDRPHIDFVMPPVGVAGSRVPYTIYGRNLPGGQPTDLKLGGATLQKMVVEISLPTAPGPGIAQRLSPSGLALDGASFSFKDSNSVRVGVATTARVVLENEPNNNPAESQLVVAPCEVAGSFYPRRDADWIQFDAKKGEVYWLDLMSHRLGANTDPYLTLQRVVKNDKGEETVSDIAQVDDPGDRNGRIGGQLDTSTDDPTYKFTVPETGRYRVMIRDQFGGAKSDPRSIYRLAIRRENPTFRLLALPQQVKVANANQILDFSPVIRKGGTTMVQVRAERRDSFQGEIKLSVAGLPEGVTCPDVFMGPTGTTAWLVFQAKADAANWSGPVTINGSATVDGAEVVQEARAASVVWGTGNKTQTPGKFRAARGLLVSVI
ncbi:MAG: PPC domain-containing protein, partial [Pirellulaceae bacterium]|nr:PPC domain-containing protein [Pirellulaceae bacterium]